MKRIGITLLLLLIFSRVLLSMGHAEQYLNWIRSAHGFHENDILTVTVSSSQNKIYATTADTLYSADADALNFKSIFQLPSGGEVIYQVYASPQQPQYLYVATSDGLFFSDNSGSTWRRIYHVINPKEKKCYAVLEDENHVYVGTGQGLLVKNFFSALWKPVDTLRSEPIYLLAQDKNFIYSGTGTALFRLDKDARTVKSLFHQGGGYDRGETDPAYREEPSKAYTRAIKDFYVDQASARAIFLAAASGIFVSEDHGDHWQKVASDNLPLDNLTAIRVVSETFNSHGSSERNGWIGRIARKKTSLLVASDKGAFFFSGTRWEHLYKGMETGRVNEVAIGPGQRVYAATNKGLFYMDPAQPVLAQVSQGKAQPVDPDSLKKYEFESEPDIHAVQAWAIDYADVDINKIRNWRVLARRRAWLPKVTIGADGTKNKTTSDSVYGSYSSGGQEYIGPDDKTFYDNFGWDVSVSWDLGDLVWSTDQTSIDSRSKMLVELREDVLEQSTRLYFERRRLQMELEQEVSSDPLMQLEKRLRVEELTALLDGMTGGKFTENILNNSR